MTSFLLIISLLLHIVSITAIYQLYKRSQIPQQENASQDMMEIFEMYLADIKEENKRLEETLVRKEFTKVNDENHAEPSAGVKSERKKEVKETTYSSPSIEEGLEQVEFEPSSQAKILQLHDQGMKSDKIARNLNLGKTEVDLIIKLHAKK